MEEERDGANDAKHQEQEEEGRDKHDDVRDDRDADDYRERTSPLRSLSRNRHRLIQSSPFETQIRAACT